MRKKFDEQLKLLHKELTKMGALCEDAIETVAKSLLSKNQTLEETMDSLNHEIKQLRRSIESLCLDIIMQQQPVAKDLRKVSSAMKMVTDLERIGEQATDMSNLIIHLHEAYVFEYNQIHQMAKDTINMVTDSMDAYVQKDAEKAKRVILFDDVVDLKFKEIKKDLIHRIAQNPDQGEDALDLFMIAKYFEGMADHAVNVARWVHFSILGYSLKENGEVEGRHNI